MPYGLRIVSLECDGFAPIYNPAWRDTKPLDLTNQAVKEFCAAPPT